MADVDLEEVVLALGQGAAQLGVGRVGDQLDRDQVDRQLDPLLGAEHLLGDLPGLQQLLVVLALGRHLLLELLHAGVDVGLLDGDAFLLGPVEHQLELDQALEGLAGRPLDVLGLLLALLLGLLLLAELGLGHLAEAVGRDADAVDRRGVRVADAEARTAGGQDGETQDGEQTAHGTTSRSRLDDDNAQAYRRVTPSGCQNAAMSYQPADGRYDTMQYRRVGRSGLLLPAISLGLWQNFGGDRPLETQRAIVRRAFDLGITHFDLANNYGPPYGSAEENFGRILATDLRGHRDELVISTKAGYDMWPGPYGDRGSRKYLLASLDQSLARMGLPYVDIFYSHRVDPDTPLSETMGALDTAVRQGKALYAGISSYSPERTREAAAILRDLGTPLLIHQPSYSMLNRWIEDDGLLEVLGDEGIGCIVFSPLAQGVLTDRYLGGVPEGSRASKPGTIDQDQLGEETLAKVQALDELAGRRGQSLAQMAVAWALRDPRVTSALLGASSVAQLEDNVAALRNLDFGDDELAEIDRHATEAGLNLWAASSEA